MRLPLRRLFRLAFAFCLLFTFFAGLVGPVSAADSADESLAWSWAVTTANVGPCPCGPGCECVGAGCGCTVATAAPAPVSYYEYQTCENGRCKIVRVPVYPAQSSEPVAPAGAWPSFPTNHGPQMMTYNTPYTAAGATGGTCANGQCSAPTTVTGSPVVAGFVPVQNFRAWNQSRPKLFGGRFRGGCGSCGG